MGFAILSGWITNAADLIYARHLQPSAAATAAGESANVTATAVSSHNGAEAVIKFTLPRNGLLTANIFESGPMPTP